MSIYFNSYLGINLLSLSFTLSCKFKLFQSQKENDTNIGGIEGIKKTLRGIVTSSGVERHGPTLKVHHKIETL
jgi:hypothetical protein